MEREGDWVERKNKRNQILVKICCVIASFILWLYIFNVEDPMRERKIVVPVTIVNKDALAQSKLVQIDNQSASISLLIKGNASNVYSVKPSDFKLQSDLNAYVMKKGENNIPVEVKKSPDNISILNNENLWIKVQLDELKQKSVPVRIGVVGKPKEGYYALDPVLNTDKVEISGAADAVNSVKYAAATCDVKYAGSDVNTSVKLQAQDSFGNVVKDVTISPSPIKVTVPIGKVKTVPINVKIQGNTGNGSVPNSIVSNPDKVDVSGDENVIKGISSLDTEPVDLSKIGSSSSIEVKLVVPKGVKLVNNAGTVELRVNINNEAAASSDKSGQKTMNLNIQVRNLNAGYTASLGSNSVSAVFNGPTNNINSLNGNNISCFVDASSLSEGTHTVNVVVSMPQGVSLVSQDPQKISIEIKKKTSEGQNGN